MRVAKLNVFFTFFPWLSSRTFLSHHKELEKRGKKEKNACEFNLVKPVSETTTARCSEKLTSLNNFKIIPLTESFPSKGGDLKLTNLPELQLMTCDFQISFMIFSDSYSAEHL